MQSAQSTFRTQSGQQGMCYLFGIIVLAPTFLLPFASSLGAGLNENREKSAAPPLRETLAAPLTSIRQFREYYNDHFPLREQAIAADSMLRFQALGASAKNRVAIGSDNWMFLRENRQRVPVSLPTAAFNKAQLNQWTSIFEQRNAAAKKYGARYFVIIAPNKASIYPDKRPGTLTDHEPDTRLQQILRALAKADVGHIDLRPALLHAKQQHEAIYYRTDTHWNSIGAWHAAEEILSQLNHDASTLRTNATTNISYAQEPFTGDLLRLLGATGFTRERWVTVTPKNGFSWSRQPFAYHGNTGVPDYMVAFSTMNAGMSTTCVVFRDSFTLDLQPFLSDGLGKATYVWNYSMDVEVVREESPDIVLDIFVERRLNSPAPNAFLTK